MQYTIVSITEVSAILPIPSLSLIWVAQQDASSLSRLGRVWSIIEPDELGSLHMWKHGQHTGWERVRDVPMTSKPTCSISSIMKLGALDEAAGKIWVGTDDGKV